MDYFQFGVKLLETEDLDPLYVALSRTTWDAITMKRWLFTYWLLYHPGAVCEVVTAPDYYNALRDALAGPRGRERRHFRGEKAESAIDYYEDTGEPEDLVDYISSYTYKDVMERAQEFPQFGPWIGFKAADMLERILHYDISFKDCYLGIYKDPVQGAALIMKGDWKAKMSKSEIIDAYDFLLDVFYGYTAPPFHDRRVNLQEVETIACKYKSHFKGHYPIGLDTIEIAEGLRHSKKNQLRDELLLHMEDLEFLL